MTSTTPYKRFVWPVVSRTLGRSALRALHICQAVKQESQPVPLDEAQRYALEQLANYFEGAQKTEQYVSNLRSSRLNPMEQEWLPDSPQLEARAKTAGLIQDLGFKDDLETLATEMVSLLRSLLKGDTPQAPELEKPIKLLDLLVAYGRQDAERPERRGRIL